MPGKVLYISYDGMTDPLGQSQVLPYLVSLSKQGYRFTILSFEKKARLDKEKSVIEKICIGAGINWQPLLYTKNPPIISKVYDRWKMKKKALQLHEKEQFSMLHCRSYIAAEVGLYLKKRKNVHFLFDMRGFWADEKVDSGSWNQQKIIYRNIYLHYKKKEKEFLLAADGIITLTSAARKILLSQSDYKDLLIDVIPCCTDLDHFNYTRISHSSKQVIKEELGIGLSKKIITYLGSLGGWYMTKEMFGFFKRLMIKDSSWVMLFLTKDDPTLIQQQAAEAGIPTEKMVTRFASRNELPAYIAQSDCSIFFIRPTFSKTASSPTKHAELMGMGIPVICNDIGDTGAIVNETGTGIVVTDFTSAEYDRVIEKLDNQLDIPKEKIRQAAFDYFDLEKGVAAYHSVYKRILKE